MTTLVPPARNSPLPNSTAHKSFVVPELLNVQVSVSVEVYITPFVAIVTYIPLP